MEREQYWLWITNIKGIGRKKINYLLESFEHPKYVWEATDGELKGVKGLKTVDREVLIQSRDEGKIESLWRKMISSDIKFYSIENSKYPNVLKNIYDPPFGIYVKGNLLENETPSIAIVGSRKCSEYGRTIAEYFGKELAKMGIIIISGLARGIDTAAHRGALKANGKTYAVLGCGVNVCYPKENFNLMKEIMSSGAIISELPINATPIAGNFPMRNRIISGLSDGVLVVEAARKSGSLITSDLALDQGKDVFAIPGRITDKLSEGTNDLIKIGAKFVTKIDDILEDIFNNYCVEKVNNSENNKISLAENEKIVYSCLSLEPLFIDEIHSKTRLPINDLAYILIKLEYKGVIKQLPNKYYIKNL